jgi:hypothetical protein
MAIIRFVRVTMVEVKYLRVSEREFSIMAAW